MHPDVGGDPTIRYGMNAVRRLESRFDARNEIRRHIGESGEPPDMSWSAPDVSPDGVVAALEKRARLLRMLADGPMDKPALRDALEVSRSTVYKALRELEELGLVHRVDDGYALTQFGRLARRKHDEFRATVGDYTCRFLTRPGLFSATELDDGTATLLQHATVQDGDRVLDCCCGYGAIGAFIGARTDCSLWATDDDRVATSYARLNFERNGVSAEDVRTGDCLDAVSDQTFDTVLSNPPTHAGSGVTQKLFTGVREVIAENGVFYLVANQIMDYDDTLSGGFDFDAEVVAETGNFDVIRAYPT